MTRVLVVDDEEDVLESTQILLELDGYEVQTAQRTGEILPKLLSMRPQVLFQDANMPGLDLEALLPTIRREASLQGLVVILFTAAANAEELLARCGADDLLQKPFDPKRIVTKIEQWTKK
ncbi:MAG TPA: response regulator [Candidatus Thermoplasmatota archaeon]|nr:response regulator [Candidatus Thermoplasmatota archaeon]